MVVPYCSKNHISDSQPFQDIVISVFLMIAQSNTMDYVQADNELVDGFGVDNQVENDSHARIAGMHIFYIFFLNFNMHARKCFISVPFFCLLI